jgi:hypothetical protein
VGVKAILTRLPGSSPILDFIAFLLTSFFENLHGRFMFHPPLDPSLPPPPPACIYFDYKRYCKKEIEKKSFKIKSFCNLDVGVQIF